MTITLSKSKALAPIIFYQMNGLVLGTFEKSALETDMNRSGLSSPGGFSLAHNVPSRRTLRV